MSGSSNVEEECRGSSNVEDSRPRMREEESLQGYLAHKKMPTPLGPPYDPRHRPTVGSLGWRFSYERGTPVGRGGECRERRRARVGMCGGEAPPPPRTIVGP